MPQTAFVQTVSASALSTAMVLAAKEVVKAMDFFSPGQVAELLGLKDGMLRLLAGQQYYAEWLETPRNQRRDRLYTPRDVAILKFVVFKHKEGCSYELIKEMLRTRGPDECIREELDAKSGLMYLQQELERLRNEQATLLRQLQVAVAEGSNQADINRRLERYLYVVHRTASEFAADARSRIQKMQDTLLRLKGEMAESDDQFTQALANVRSVEEQIGAPGLVNRLRLITAGGALAKQLTEARVRLEVAERERNRTREAYDQVLGLANQFMLERLQEAIQQIPDSVQASPSSDAKAG